MSILVASERDFPIIDILAVHNYEVDVVIFKHPLFYLTYDSPHASCSEEGIRVQDNDDVRFVAR
jgi:hypothetical protein